MADVEFSIDQSTTTITLTSSGYLIETEVNAAVDFMTLGVQGPPGINGAAGSRVKSEIPQGAINGTNKVFTLSSPIVSIIDIQVNGLGGEAFTNVTEYTFELIQAPEQPETLKVIYSY